VAARKVSGTLGCGRKRRGGIVRIARKAAVEVEIEIGFTREIEQLGNRERAVQAEGQVVLRVRGFAVGLAVQRERPRVQNGITRATRRLHLHAVALLLPAIAYKSADLAGAPLRTSPLLKISVVGAAPVRAAATPPSATTTAATAAAPATAAWT